MAGRGDSIRAPSPVHLLPDHPRPGERARVKTTHVRVPGQQAVASVQIASHHTDARLRRNEFTNHVRAKEIPTSQNFDYAWRGVTGTCNQQAPACLRIAKNAAPPLGRIRRKVELVS